MYFSDFVKSHALKGSLNITDRTISEHVNDLISLTNQKYSQTNQQVIHIVPLNFLLMVPEMLPIHLALLQINLSRT